MLKCILGIASHPRVTGSPPSDSVLPLGQVEGGWLLSKDILVLLALGWSTGGSMWDSAFVPHRGL